MRSGFARVVSGNPACFRGVFGLQIFEQYKLNILVKQSALFVIALVNKTTCFDRAHGITNKYPIRWLGFSCHGPRGAYDGIAR